MSDERLSRMETKLDKLSEAIIYMARMEERLVSVDKGMNKINDLFKKLDERLNYRTCPASNLCTIFQ